MSFIDLIKAGIVPIAESDELTVTIPACELRVGDRIETACRFMPVQEVTRRQTAIGDSAVVLYWGWRHTFEADRPVRILNRDLMVRDLEQTVGGAA